MATRSVAQDARPHNTSPGSSSRSAGAADGTTTPTRLSHKSSTRSFSALSHEPLLRTRASLRSLRSPPSSSTKPASSKNNNAYEEERPPTRNNLDAADRTALIRSARKLGRVLGATPQLVETLILERGSNSFDSTRSSHDLPPAARPGTMGQHRDHRRDPPAPSHPPSSSLLGRSSSTSIRASTDSKEGTRLTRRSTLTAAENFFTKSFSKPSSLSRRTSMKLLGSTTPSSPVLPVSSGGASAAKVPLLHLAVAPPTPSASIKAHRRRSSTSDSHSSHSHPHPLNHRNSLTPPPSPTVSFGSISSHAPPPASSTSHFAAASSVSIAGRGSESSDRSDNAALARVHRMKMAKLQRHLGENVPVELVLGIRPPTTALPAPAAKETKPLNTRKRLSVDLSSILSPALSQSATQAQGVTSPSEPAKPKHKKSRSIWRLKASSPVDSPPSTITSPSTATAAAAESPREARPKTAPSNSHTKAAAPTGTTGTVELGEEALHLDELSEKEKNLNVKRAYKMAQVFGVPPPHELFTSKPLPSSHSSESGEVTPNGRISRLSLASLAYMLDHDRDSLYDLLSSAPDPEDEPDGQPVDWPYEKRKSRQRTISTATGRSANGLAAKQPGSAPSSNPASRRQSLAAAAVPAPSAADNKEQGRSSEQGRGSVSRRPSVSAENKEQQARGSVSRRPSFNASSTSLNAFVPPTSWDTHPKSPLPSLPDSPVPLSPTPSSTSLIAHAKSVREPAKLRKAAPKEKVKEAAGGGEKDRDFSARRRRAAKLSRFFGVGYNDLFASMLAFPASGAPESPESPSHGQGVSSPLAFSSSPAAGQGQGASRSAPQSPGGSTLTHAHAGAPGGLSGSGAGPTLSSSSSPSSPSAATTTPGIGAASGREIKATRGIGETVGPEPPTLEQHREAEHLAASAPASSSSPLSAALLQDPRHVGAPVPVPFGPFSSTAASGSFPPPGPFAQSPSGLFTPSSTSGSVSALPATGSPTTVRSPTSRAEARKTTEVHVVLGSGSPSSRGIRSNFSDTPGEEIQAVLSRLREL